MANPAKVIEALYGPEWGATMGFVAP